MIKVEIKPSQVTCEERSGRTEKGKDWVSREQQGYLFNGGEYPVLFVFGLADGQLPYEAGYYEMAEQSIVVGKYNRPEFARVMVLRPLQNNKA